MWDKFFIIEDESIPPDDKVAIGTSASSLFETALETIIQRGKTNLGDKTIADSLNLIIKKLKDEQNYLVTFKNATKEALANFKGKKIKIGRARMFEDKTKDLDDPGMYALYLLCSKL